MELVFKRKVCNPGVTDFVFEVEGKSYLVKNFGDQPVFVALKKTEDKEECLKIPGGTAQVVQPTMNSFLFGSSEVTVIADAESEVEIQCLMW